MRTEYASVRFNFSARITPGKPRQEIDARNGIKLVRVTKDGRDDLFVGGVGALVEIPWSNVASAVRAAPEKAKDEA